ncbi:MAG: Nramp family divalent metal transporter [Planctomyces sp.]|nr:Nramp family divalent metal transporter [Planctomyces sp.]
MREHRDHGCLPDWRTEEMPEPLPITTRNVLKTIGPGAILLAGSIGGGEWIVGPMTAVKYGPGILWVATAGILLQWLFNMEAIRYTLYTGEPVLTGIMRLRPGAKVWGALYIVLGILQLATPALALGCASVLFAAGSNGLPDASGADRGTVMWISYAVLGLTVLLLLSGKSIERMLERLSWAMVIFIFAFLTLANILFVPFASWIQTAKGFLIPSRLPENMDIVLLGVFAATAGSGGLGNLAISNWCRDKGFGMGRWVGSIGGILAEGHTELSSTGCVFRATKENLRRWSIWWKYSLIDQTALWAFGCVVGMFLNVNLALQIVPVDKQLTGYEAGTFQAQFMAERLWSGFWFLALFNGFWILFSTQLGNMDCLTRVVSDVCWSGWPKLQKLTSSRLYARWLMVFLVWGVVALTIGDNVVALFKILGLLASPILAIGALQILLLNRRFLPKEIQPPVWRQLGLILCCMTFTALSAASFYDLLTKN